MKAVRRSTTHSSHDHWEHTPGSLGEERNWTPVELGREWAIYASVLHARAEPRLGEVVWALFKGNLQGKNWYKARVAEVTKAKYLCLLYFDGAHSAAQHDN